MISISQQPAGPILSDNDVIFEITATDPDGNPFRYQGPRLEVKPTNGRFSAGTFFFINITEPNGLSIAVLFQANEGEPQGETTNIPSSSDGSFANDLAYWIAVAQVIQDHPRIHPLLRVYADQNPDSSYSLWLVVRDYVLGWELSTGPNNFTAWTEEFFADLTNTRPIGHRLVFETYFEPEVDQGGWERISRQSTAVGSNSRNRYNLSEVLGSAIRSQLKAPLVKPWDTVGNYISPTRRRFFFRAGEVALEDGFQVDQGVTEYLTVIGGGVANSVAAQADFLLAINQNNSWLTWRDDNQLVSYRQPYYLSWLSYFPGAEFGIELISPFLEIEEYTEDNTRTARFIGQGEATQAEQSTVTVYAVGPEALGIDLESVYYRVRVVTPTNVLDDPPAAASPWRTFWIDQSYRQEERYLAYTNAFLCPEIVRCIGDLDKEVEFTYKESRSVRNNPSSTQAQIRNFQPTWKDLFTFNTGFITDREADVLTHEIPLAFQFFEISPNGYIPLKLETKSFGISSTRQNLHNISLEATPAIIERNYSRVDEELIMPPVEVWGSPDSIGIWASPIAQPWA